MAKPKFVGGAINPTLIKQYRQGADKFKQPKGSYTNMIEISEIKEADNNPRKLYSFCDAILHTLFRNDDLPNCKVTFVFRSSDSNEDVLVQAEEWIQKQADPTFLAQHTKVGIMVPEYSAIALELSALVNQHQLGTGAIKQEIDYNKLVSLASSIFVSGLINPIKIAEIKDSAQYVTRIGTRRRLATQLILKDVIESQVTKSSDFNGDPIGEFKERLTENNNFQGYSLGDYFYHIEELRRLYKEKEGRYPTNKEIARDIERPIIFVTWLSKLVKDETSDGELVKKAIQQELIQDYSLLRDIKSLANAIKINPAEKINRNLLTNNTPAPALAEVESLKNNKKPRRTGRSRTSVKIALTDLTVARRVVGLLVEGLELTCDDSVDNLGWEELQSILNQIK